MTKKTQSSDGRPCFSRIFYRFRDLLWTLREPQAVALLSDEEKVALAEFDGAVSGLPWQEVEGNPRASELPGDDLSPLIPSGERLFRLLDAHLARLTRESGE